MAASGSLRTSIDSLALEDNSTSRRAPLGLAGWAGVCAWAGGVAIGAAVTIAATTQLDSDWELLGLLVVPLGISTGMSVLPSRQKPPQRLVGRRVRSAGGVAAVILGIAVAHSGVVTKLLVGGYLTGMVGAALVVALARRYRRV